MRPHLLDTRLVSPSGPVLRWVDLDTVQWVQEPIHTEGNREVVIVWQHAFRDRPDSISFVNEVYYDQRKQCLQPVRVEGKCHTLALVQQHIFAPFFLAWSKTK